MELLSVSPPDVARVLDDAAGRLEVVPWARDDAGVAAVGECVLMALQMVAGTRYFLTAFDALERHLRIDPGSDTFGLVEWNQQADGVEQVRAALRSAAVQLRAGVPA